MPRVENNTSLEWGHLSWIDCAAGTVFLFYENRPRPPKTAGPPLEPPSRTVFFSVAPPGPSAAVYVDRPQGARSVGPGNGVSTTGSSAGSHSPDNSWPMTSGRMRPCKTPLAASRSAAASCARPFGTGPPPLADAALLCPGDPARGHDHGQTSWRNTLSHLPCRDPELEIPWSVSLNRDRASRLVVYGVTRAGIRGAFPIPWRWPWGGILPRSPARSVAGRSFWLGSPAAITGGIPF